MIAAELDGPASDDAQRFQTIFSGLARVHGQYVVPAGAKPTDKGKLHNTTWARTVHEPVTLDLWQRHLKQGGFGLGIVPIRDDATCSFGGIDVDVYRLADKTASDLYVHLLPAINGRKVDLLDNDRLTAQLVGLERRAARSGRDMISHAPGGHDDLANVVAGAVHQVLGRTHLYADTSIRGPIIVRLERKMS